MNLSLVFESTARRVPNKPAIVTPTQTWTYRDLADLVDRLTGSLVRRHLDPGDVIGIVLGNSPHHLATLIAAARLGLTVMAVDTNWTASEIVAVLDRFETALVIVDAETQDKVTGPAVDVDMLAAGSPYKGKLPVVSGDSAYMLMLSSGTTGQPKGAEVSYSAMAFRFMAQVVEFGLTEHDVYLGCMSLQAGGGRSFSLSHLYLGGTVILPPKFVAAHADELIRKYAVTNTVMVPTMLHRVLDLPDQGGWPSIRMVLSSGSRLGSPERDGIRTRYTPHLWDYYASVEAGGVSIQRPEDIALKPDSVGRPMWGTDVAIRDGDNELLAGSIGDIFYRSPGMATCYRGGDSSAFRDGWYRTGDVGFLDAERFLHLTGRSKEMIITGGTNVYPAEIEAALTTFAGIKRAAVVGIPDPEWGERVVSVVEINGAIDVVQFQIHLRSTLAGPKRPKAVYIVDSIPVTTADKIDRHAVVLRILENDLERLV